MDVTFFDVFLSVGGLLLLMVPGYILVKTKLLPPSSDSHLSNIVLYISTTLLMFIGFQKTTFDSRIALNTLIVAGIAFLIHFLMIGLLFLIFRKNDPKSRVIRCAGVFANCGYMGIPFLTSLFKDDPVLGEVLIYAAVIMVVFYIILWTLGIFMSSGNAKDISAKKILLNPILIATILSIIIFFTVQKPFVDLCPEGSIGDQLITKLISTIEVLASLVTPLSMIIIGMKLANIKFKELFNSPVPFLTSAFKLVVMPVIAMLVVAFLPIDQSIKYTIFFISAMPTAALVVLFSIKYEGDSVLASKAVLLSDILSIVTIPLLFLLFQFVTSLI